MGVPGADEAGLGIGESDFGAQDVELSNHASTGAAVDITQFLFQQGDEGFLGGDVLFGEQNIVIGAADFEQGVGDDSIVLEQGHFFEEFGGAKGGTDATAFVDGLNHADVSIPTVLAGIDALDRFATAQAWRHIEGEAFDGLIVIIGSAADELRNGDSTGLYGDAVGGFDIGA